jgi:hypothetical protein
MCYTYQQNLKRTSASACVTGTSSTLYQRAHVIQVPAEPRTHERMCYGHQQYLISTSACVTGTSSTLDAAGAPCASPVHHRAVQIARKLLKLEKKLPCRTSDLQLEAHARAVGGAATWRWRGSNVQMEAQPPAPGSAATCAQDPSLGDAEIEKQYKRDASRLPYSPHFHLVRTLTMTSENCGAVKLHMRW